MTKQEKLALKKEAEKQEKKFKGKTLKQIQEEIDRENRKLLEESDDDDLISFWE